MPKQTLRKVRQICTISTIWNKSPAPNKHGNYNYVLNKLVHNNDWANGTEGDFQPVLVAATEFLDLFKCTNAACGSWITLSGDALRCACQTYNLNLRKK